MLNNLIVSVNCVIPILTYLLVGFFCKKMRIVPEEVYGYLNKLCFSVLLSILMFYNVSHADISNGFPRKLILFLCACTVGLMALAYLILHRKVKDPRRMGVYLQVAYRTNLAIIGLALAEVLVDREGITLISVTITILGPLYNIMAICILEAYSEKKTSFTEKLINVLKNPFVIGAILGFPFALFRIHIPEAIELALGTLGKTGSTLVLITLGASFEFSNMKKDRILVILCSITRLILAPLLVISIAVAIGFRNNELATILIASATPFATAAYTMARVYNSDYALTGEIVIATSLFSCATLFCWIFLLKQLCLI